MEFHRIASPTGKRVRIQRDRRPKENFSIAFMCRMDEERPVFAEFMQPSKVHRGFDSDDFLDFIEKACTTGYLRKGDILIGDNWPGHCAADIVLEMDEILKGHGVTLIFLPKYSPELNPCELCFSRIKAIVRRRVTSDNYLQSIVDGILSLDAEIIGRFYRKCVWHPTAKK
jgi:hypothetical protein